MSASTTPTATAAVVEVREPIGDHPWCPCCGEIPWCQEEIAADGGDYAPHIYFPNGFGG